jgi:hypothetical protein
MQKMAWLFVIITVLAVVASAVAVVWLYAEFGMPKAVAGLTFMGIAGLGGLGPLIFKKDSGKVTCDERDRLINRRAALAGFGMAYMFVGAVCMAPFFVLGPDGSISVTWLPMIFMGAGICTFFAHSVAILLQYGRGSKGEKS